MPRPWPATCWSRSPRAASRTTSWTSPSGPAGPVIGGPRSSPVPRCRGSSPPWDSGTAGLAVGDEVFGLTDQWRDGTAAEYVAVEARNLAPKPKTVGPRARRGGAAGWPDGVAGPVRSRKAGQGADRGHPRRGRRGRVDGRPACPLGRRRGDRDRAQPFPVPGPGTGRRPLRRPGRRPPRGRGRPGGPGVRRGRRRGARPVGLARQARGNAGLDQAERFRPSAARTPGRSSSSRNQAALS